MIEVDQPENQQLKIQGLKNIGILDDFEAKDDQRTYIESETISYRFLNKEIDDEQLKKAISRSLNFKNETVKKDE